MRSSSGKGKIKIIKRFLIVFMCLVMLVAVGLSVTGRQDLMPVFGILVVIVIVCLFYYGGKKLVRALGDNEQVR